MKKKRSIAALLVRFNHRCLWCGTVVQTDLPSGHKHLATREHLLPFSAGGADRADNLALACYPCNNARGGSAEPPPTACREQVEHLSDGHRWAWGKLLAVEVKPPDLDPARVATVARMRKRARWLTERSKRSRL